MDILLSNNLPLMDFFLLIWDFSYYNQCYHKFCLHTSIHRSATLPDEFPEVEMVKQNILSIIPCCFLSTPVPYFL
jgi:hypothetical protein